MRFPALVVLVLLLCAAGGRAADLSSLTPETDLSEAVFALAREADPNVDIDSARTAFEALVKNARERIGGGNVFDKTDALARVLAENGFVAAENGRRRGSMLLPAVLETRRGNCMGFSLLYACLAQKLNLPLKIALIPEHAFIVCQDGSNRQCVETLMRGARYGSFSEFMQARAETLPPNSGFRSERPAGDGVAEAVRLDRRLQSREYTSASLRSAVLNSPRDVFALLLTQVAGELDGQDDNTQRLAFCAQAAAWDPHLAVAQESWGHFIHLQYGLSAAREKLLTASTLQQEQGWLQSALRSAAASGSAERVRELLKKGAPVYARDAQGRTALHFASNAEVVQLLLNAGADLQSTAHDGSSALHFAAKFGADEAVSALLTAGLKATQTDAYGRAPIHYAAMYDHEHAIERLLAGGVEINFPTTGGSTPLHLAAESGSPRAVAALLKANANASLKNNSGATALNIAASHGQSECARLLLEAGSAASDADADGITPLHWAARRGRDGLVKLLIERGADVNARDREGRTPLIFTAFSESEACAQLLLSHKADVNAKTRVGRTALHNAAHFNSVGLMRVLLSHGADPNAADSYGRSPLDYCNTATREALK